MKESLMRLKGKVAIVTGAAQGIGKAIAEVFAHEGAFVIISDIQEKKGQSVADSLDGRGVFIYTDLNRDVDISKMFDFAFDKYGAIDILINNAAGPKSRNSGKDMVGDWMVKDWDETMDTSLRAYMVTSRYARTFMKQNNGGRIINMGSILSTYIGEHLSCSYHVSKAGISHLTRYLAWHFGKDNIQVNCISPGLVDRSEGFCLTDDPVNKAVVDIMTPLKRAAISEDIAYAALFLCSDEAKYITGQNLTLDGGSTLGGQFEVTKAAYTANKPL
jgi:NAD(P)-dependent dehydrogenase (short-subunit alcohol dehydrogenase family)